VLSGLGISGGAVDDALVALAAAEHGASWPPATPGPGPRTRRSASVSSSLGDQRQVRAQDPVNGRA
jgi:hypothetical protein